MLRRSDKEPFLKCSLNHYIYNPTYTCLAGGPRGGEWLEVGPQGRSLSNRNRDLLGAVLRGPLDLLNLPMDPPDVIIQTVPLREVARTNLAAKSSVEVGRHPMYIQVALGTVFFSAFRAL